MQTIDRGNHVAQELERATYIRPRRWLPLITLLSLTGAALLVLVGLLSRWAGLATPAVRSAGLTGGVGLAAGLLLAVAWLWVERCYQNQGVLRDQLRAGLEGERMLPTYLAPLPDDYVLINNLPLPGLDADVDHILVGPNGLFVIETKHHRGVISASDGHWYQAKISRSGWLQPAAEFRSPVRQVKRNVDRLRRYLNRQAAALCRSTRLWMEPVVVFTHPEAQLQITDDVRQALPVRVLHGEDLLEFVALYQPRQPLTKSQVRQVVSVLSHMET